MKLPVQEKSGSIMAVPAVQVFIVSDCILIKERGGFSLRESIHAVGLPTSPYDLTSPQGLRPFCNLMYSRKREGCVWLLSKFFCEIKNASDFCVTIKCLAWAFLMLAHTPALGFMLFMFLTHRRPRSCWMPCSCWMYWMIRLDLLFEWSVKSCLYLFVFLYVYSFCLFPLQHGYFCPGALICTTHLHFFSPFSWLHYSYAVLVTNSA